ncbi:DUF1793-domain-containing protein, partial [Saccharata proteae CBS 121410]
YSPARPPAVPLAVRSPYTNAWSSTADNGTLNTSPVIFWTGQTIGWEGIITVDGISYEWLGNGLSALPSVPQVKSATPLTVSYDSQYSNFTFQAGPVELTASFLSAVIPQDLCRTSIPLSYLEVSYRSTDNATHSVQIYNDVDDTWLNYDGSAAVDYGFFADQQTVTPNTTFNSDSEFTYSELNDFPQWGNFSYATSPGASTNFTYQSGPSLDLRFQYIMNQYLSGAMVSNGTDQIFAYSHDFGASLSGSVLYTVGTIQEPQINLITQEGLQDLSAWWASDECYGPDQLMLISTHYGDYAASQQMAAQFDTRLRADAQSYYSIVALSARQVMGAYVLTSPPIFSCGNASSKYNSSEPFMFQKEISSDGNVNTVDVLYPAMPFFLYVNPAMLRYTLNPLFLNQEAGYYPRAYSMHDLGSNFPNATGHPKADDEQMPVEESGNMILMTYAYYKFSGDANYLSEHYDKLFQWAGFLTEYTLIPTNQLSTDDFLGSLSNQTNLAIKGIVGLGAMSSIASITGHAADATNFSTTTTSYYQQWENLAIDPSGTHTILAYQWRSSWGLLYNTYPDKLLSLGVVSQAVYDMQSTYYPTVSQIYGIPLDNRHSITKSDWELWTAATCSAPTRRLFVNALAYWLNNTSTNLPTTDLYDTIGTGGYPDSDVTARFINRPVVGGHYSLLAMLRAGEDAATGTSVEAGLLANSSDTVEGASSLPVLPMVKPTAAPTWRVLSGSFLSTSSAIASTSVTSVA